MAHQKVPISYLEASESLGLVASLGRLTYLWWYSFIAEAGFGAERVSFALTLRRITILVAIACVLPAIVCWNHLGFWLDDIFFPAWRKTDVTAPVFLIGNARSGTTWVHRLLTEANDEVFTTFRTWEILFAVPIVWKVLFTGLYLLDKHIFFGLFLYLILNAERGIVGHITVHPIGLMEAEEDEWLMLHVGLAQLLLFLFPSATNAANPLILFDYLPASLPDIHAALKSSGTDARKVLQRRALLLDRSEMLSLSMRLRIFDYYRTCVQRHLYFQQFRREWQRRLIGARAAKDDLPLVFMSKNPAFTLRVPSLLATFPDAKVICLLRDPAQSVPSMISYISLVWHAFASPLQRYPNASQLLGFCEVHYLFPLVHLAELSRSAGVESLSRSVFLSYHALQRPQMLLKTLQSEVLQPLFGVEMSERILNTRMKQRLLHEEAHTASYRTEHIYRFDDCCEGLSLEQLRERLQIVYYLHKDAFKR